MLPAVEQLTILKLPRRAPLVSPDKIHLTGGACFTIPEKDN